MMNLSRRIFLKHVPAAAAAVAIPVTAVAAPAPTPEERLKLAAAEVRAAMTDMGVESYMVMIREESSSVAKMLDFNRDGTLHRMLELG